MDPMEMCIERSGRHRVTQILAARPTAGLDTVARARRRMCSQILGRSLNVHLIGTAHLRNVIRLIRLRLDPMTVQLNAFCRIRVTDSAKEQDKVPEKKEQLIEEEEGIIEEEGGIIEEEGEAIEAEEAVEVMEVEDVRIRTEEIKAVHNLESWYGILVLFHSRYYGGSLRNL